MSDSSAECLPPRNNNNNKKSESKSKSKSTDTVQVERALCAEPPDVYTAGTKRPLDE